MGVPVDIVGCDGEFLAVGQVHLAFHEVAQADLRTLQIGQQADRLAHRLRRSAGLVQTLLVLGMVAVAHVETGYVQTRCDQLFHPLLGRRRRPERTHDLCSTHGTTLAEIASATRKQQ